MEMKKVALFVAMVVMVSIEASAANSVVNNRKMVDSDILLKVDSSLGQCWGKFCAPWSPCQSGCLCVGPVGTGACVGLSNEFATSAAKMVNSDVFINALNVCQGRGCAPWSPCQPGCTCIGAGGVGFCFGPSSQ